MSDLVEDRDPKLFEELWHAGEGDVLDPVINKHVTLALQDFVKSADPMLWFGERGEIRIVVSYGAYEEFETRIDLEKLLLETLQDKDAIDYHSTERWRRMSEFFKRVADLSEKLASEKAS